MAWGRNTHPKRAAEVTEVARLAGAAVRQPELAVVAVRQLRTCRMARRRWSLRHIQLLYLLPAT